MTPDLALVIERVSAEVGDLIDALDREGAVYAGQYAQHVMTHRPGGPGPRPPKGMPPVAATVIREFVLDQLAHRRAGARHAGLGGRS
jgi:hypothetical protein